MCCKIQTPKKVLKRIDEYKLDQFAYRDVWRKSVGDVLRGVVNGSDGINVDDIEQKRNKLVIRKEKGDRADPLGSLDNICITFEKIDGYDAYDVTVERDTSGPVSRFAGWVLN